MQIFLYILSLSKYGVPTDRVRVIVLVGIMTRRPRPDQIIFYLSSCSSNENGFTSKLVLPVKKKPEP